MLLASSAGLCARSFLYETVLAPAGARLKAEIAKVPALEFLVAPGGQAEAASAVRHPLEAKHAAFTLLFRYVQAALCLENGAAAGCATAWGTSACQGRLRQSVQK